MARTLTFGAFANVTWSSLDLLDIRVAHESPVSATAGFLLPMHGVLVAKLRKHLVRNAAEEVRDVSSDRHLRVVLSWQHSLWCANIAFMMAPPELIAESPSSMTAAADEAFIRNAVEEADLNVLRMALYQATRDESLLAMRVHRISVRGGATEQSGARGGAP